jgi:hypothetical protein
MWPSLHAVVCESFAAVHVMGPEAFSMGVHGAHTVSRTAVHAFHVKHDGRA